MRLLYATAFMFQLLFVVLAGGVLLLFLTPQATTSTLMSQMLVALALAQLPLALGIAYGLSRSDTKGGAMAASIALGVLLATPAWLALFAWLIGSAPRYLLVLLGLLVLYYVLGLALAGRTTFTTDGP